MKKRTSQINKCLKNASLKYVVVNKNGNVCETETKPNSQDTERWSIAYAEMGENLKHIGDVKHFLNSGWRKHIYLKDDSKLGIYKRMTI